MSTKSTHVWTVENIFILEGLENAQHFPEVYKSMYTGVAFTLDMIPHKIITLSKVFCFKSYLSLVLSTDRAQSPFSTAEVVCT